MTVRAKMTAAERNRLLRKYHTLARKVGMQDDDRIVFLEANFGVSSSTELSADELREMCKLLQDTLNAPEDVWRKRVMAAIGGYLRRMGYESNARMIKAVACRVTGYKAFNKIPISRLRDAYNEFLRKQKVAKNTEVIDKELSTYADLVKSFQHSKQAKFSN